MINDKKIAVVVPAYNEETQISVVIDTMPEFVDRIIVVNDCSKDRTADIVKEYIDNKKESSIEIPWVPKEIQPNFFNRADIVEMEMYQEEEKLYPRHEIYNNNVSDKIVLINNLENAKVGGAIAVGYKWCRDHNIDCTAVMAGDAQMDPSELRSICAPVVFDGIDYTKGNRLSHKTAKKMIPPKRRFGNTMLSALTKISSGYWRVSDTQTGYTAISLRALKKIDLYDIYRNYGMPNDMLIKLNIEKCSIQEIPIKPVYAIGEQSKMKIGKVIPTVSMLLVCGFFRRILRKYCKNDFHPIFLFYFCSLLSGVVNLYFLGYIVYGLTVLENVTVGTYEGFAVSFFATIIMLGFAMWFDMYDNDWLQITR